MGKKHRRNAGKDPDGPKPSTQEEGSEDVQEEPESYVEDGDDQDESLSDIGLEDDLGEESDPSEEESENLDSDEGDEEDQTSPDEESEMASAPDTDNENNESVFPNQEEGEEPQYDMLEILDRFAQQDGQAKSEGRILPATDAVVTQEFSAESVVNKINWKAEETINEGQRIVDKGTMDIGDIVMDEVLHGDFETVISRGFRKSPDWKAVLEHKRLKCDRRRLPEWVRTAAVRRLLRQHDRDDDRLTKTHYDALGTESDINRILELARKAIDGGYSARMIRESIKDSKQKALPEDVGKSLQRNLASVFAVMEKEELVRTGSNKALLQKDLSKRQRKLLLKEIRQGKPQMERLQDFLNDLESNLEEIDEGTERTHPAGGSKHRETSRASE